MVGDVLVCIFEWRHASPSTTLGPSNGQVEVDGGGGGLVEGNADNQLDYVVPR